MNNTESVEPSAVNTEQEDQLKALKAEIALKKGKLDETINIIANHEGSIDQFKKTQQAHTVAQKEANELEKQRAKLSPQYEALKCNDNILEVSTKLKEKIDGCLKFIEDVSAETAKLDQELTETSKQYKEETNERDAYLKKIMDLVTSIQQMIKDKIELTIDSDGMNAMDSIEQLTDAIRSRESQLSVLKKSSNEHREICNIHDERIKDLKRTTSENERKLREQKDEAIRESVWNFQNERAQLHRDIEDMKQIFKEQSSTLRAGDVQKKPELYTWGPRTVPFDIHEAEEKSMEERAATIAQENYEMREEIHNTDDEIKQTIKAKADAISENKRLAVRIRRNREVGELALSKIEEDIRGTRLATKRTIAESDKIALIVKDLSRQVVELREAAGKSRASTIPLPVE